jgi:hypothetical protein
VPEARFEVGDLKTVKLPRCSAVPSFGEVLSYATEMDVETSRLIARAYWALRPGGVFQFNIAIRGRLRAACLGRRG